MTRSLDHDHDLPKEELASTVYPSMLSLKLENCPGDLQISNVKAISDLWGVDSRCSKGDPEDALSKCESNELGGKAVKSGLQGDRSHILYHTSLFAIGTGTLSLNCTRFVM